MATRQQAIQFKRDLETLNDNEIRQKYSDQLMDELIPLLEELEQQQPTGEAPGFIDRALAGFATTPGGEANIYQEQGINAYVDPSTNRVMVNTPDGPQPVDPEGFDVGDIADMVGRTPRTVGGVVGGLPGLFATPFTGLAGMAASAGGSTAGSVAGAGLEQGIASLLGANEGINLGDLGEEAMWGAAGGAAGEGLALGSRWLSKVLRGGGPSDITQKAITEPAEQLKADTGVDFPLPLTARTESPTAAMLERRGAESPLTGDLWQQNYGEPMTEASQTAFERITGRFTDRPPGDEGAGGMVSRAAEQAGTMRDKEINAAYERYRQLVPPRAPVDISNTQEALFSIMDMVGAGKDFGINKATRQELGTWLDDLEKITTFEELDIWRKAVGALPESQMARLGLDKHVKRLYGAVNEDLKEFTSRGGVSSPELLEQARMREEQMALAAERSRREVGAESMTLGQAIEKLGGLSVEAADRNVGQILKTDSPRVRRYLRRLERAAERKNTQPIGMDHMADRLSQQYPQFNISDTDDLIEALGREDKFFEKVPIHFEDAADIMAKKSMDDIEGQLDFRDIESLEFNIQNQPPEQMDNLIEELKFAFEKGDISEFDKSRLTKLAAQRKLNDLADTGSEVDPKTFERVDELVTADRERVAGLSDELPQREMEARTKASENFGLLQSDVNRWLQNTDKSEGIVDRVLSKATKSQDILKLKQLIAAVDTPSGQKAQEYGATALQALQAEVIEDIRDKTLKQGTQFLEGEISGTKLAKELKRIGRPKLNALFDRELTDQLFNYAQLLGAIEQRGGVAANWSGTAPAAQLLSFPQRLFKDPIATLAGLVGQMNFFGGAVTPGSKTQKFFTNPKMDDPARLSQQGLRLIGRGAAQLIDQDQ